MPKWERAPEDLVRRFEESARPLPGVTLRKMFGYPAAFTSGNMFAGLFQSSVLLRLSERDRESLLSKAGARPFEPMPGRVMKEYVVVPPSVAESVTELEAWLRRALAHASSLPPKKK